MAGEPGNLLRQRGIQVTAQRLAVLRAVSAQPHITADVVADVVRREIGTISLQSVYDTLSLLVTERLVRRIQPAGSAARFEDRVGDNHHHLICRVCGRVVDVDCSAPGAPCITPADDKGYEVDEAEVAFWGRCPDCATAAGTASTDDPPASPQGRVRRPRKDTQAVAPITTTQNPRPAPQVAHPQRRGQRHHGQ